MTPIYRYAKNIFYLYKTLQKDGDDMGYIYVPGTWYHIITGSVICSTYRTGCMNNHLSFDVWMYVIDDDSTMYDLIPASRCGNSIFRRCLLPVAIYLSYRCIKNDRNLLGTPESGVPGTWYRQQVPGTTFWWMADKGHALWRYRCLARSYETICKANLYCTSIILRIISYYRYYTGISYLYHIAIGIIF